ncbi:hypothetical protein UlMin_000355 [Ulmus minor]
MTAYLEKFRELLGQFDTIVITQVPKSDNSNADALARLATSLENNLLKIVPVEVLETPSIVKSELIAQVAALPSWMDPFISYLHDGVLSNDRDQARSLCLRATRYLFKNNMLYKRGINAPIVRCL